MNPHYEPAYDPEFCKARLEAQNAKLLEALQEANIVLLPDGVDGTVSQASADIATKIIRAAIAEAKGGE